jgi:rhodanese-related sulfurtransferase
MQNTATADSPASTVPGSAFLEIAPRDLQARIARGELVLVDVREPDEHARERIAGARLLPLSRFNADTAASWVAPGQGVAFHCRGGRRSLDACRMASSLAARGIVVHNMTGGIDAWKKDALPVELDTKVSGISIMRQVQLVVGVLALAGSALAWFVDPRFVAVPAFLGAGLTFAGATGTCALASILGVMPWNRAAGGAKSCSTGTCG